MSLLGSNQGKTIKSTLTDLLPKQMASFQPTLTWYMLFTGLNSAMRKYSSVALWATGRYSSQASVILRRVSLAVIRRSVTSCAYQIEDTVT